MARKNDDQPSPARSAFGIEYVEATEQRIRSHRGVWKVVESRL